MSATNSALGSRSRVPPGLRLGAVARALLPVAAAYLCLGPSLGIPSAAAEDTITELYRLSGAQEAVGQYPRTLEADMAEHREDTSPRMVRAMRTALAEAVDSTRIDSTFLARLHLVMSEATAREGLKFLKSPTGRTVTEAERSLNTPEGIAQMKAFLEEDIAESDPARLDLLRILDEATGSSESLANANLAMKHAIAVAFEAARPPEDRQGSDVLWALVLQGEAQARLEAEVQTRTYYRYVYRAVTKKELREYIDFAISETGLEYHRALNSVLSQTILDINRGMAAVLARELMPK
ncbi:MAG TPA: hypothetical protein VFS09_01870 [Candidatus Eisenbacteria bacterium]|nr:hypothetical protein [Candidatus Eisenbacteria bacterium]